jgi:hypothetical protein
MDVNSSFPVFIITRKNLTTGIRQQCFASNSQRKAYAQYKGYDPVFEPILYEKKPNQAPKMIMCKG